MSIHRAGSSSSRSNVGSRAKGKHSLSALRPGLLAWYRANRRDLPWRRVRDPYAIWVSEVMLQQTTVAAATPYWERFLAAFPTVQDLAEAPVERVLQLWSGLGYYRRARNLHSAAQVVAESADPRVPETVEELRALPGIGRYTAAAIASLAFGVPAPVVDGNVERVLGRLAGLTSDPRRAAGARIIEAMALELLDPSAPGDSNQALMEIGATVCSPRRPRCPVCPLARACAARQLGEPERFPLPRARRPGIETVRAAVCVRDGRGHLLFVRAAADGPNAGLWEFPSVELSGDGRSTKTRKSRACPTRIARSATYFPASGPGKPSAHDTSGDLRFRKSLASLLRKQYGLALRVADFRGRIRHTITFRRITVHLAEAELAAPAPRGPQWRWIAERSASDEALSGQARKLLALIGCGGGTRPAR